MSKYEEQIAKVLQKEGLTFEREKTFEDLKHGKLRYDFYVPSFRMLIECDGEQHFNYISKFYKTRKDFLSAQERDRKKNAYALAHKYYLYRIPFYDIPNITSFLQILNQKYKVISIYHNDYLKYQNSNIKK